MKKIRYGIIGFGSFAERAIMPALRASANAELTAIQKRSPEMAKWKAQEHGVPFYFDSVEALVSSPEVDAVFIVSANSEHCRETLLAAAAKKHVLVEKPMAVSMDEANSMADTCRRNGVQLMVGHMLRFSPLLKRIKELVHTGSIGDVTAAHAQFVYDASVSTRQWVLDKKIAGAGPLFDIGIHCLDALRFILNDDTAVAVHSIMNPGPESGSVERTNLLSIAFSRGAMASIHTSYESSYRQTYLEVNGKRGSLSAYYFTPSNTETELKITYGENGQVRRVETEKVYVPNLYTAEIEEFSSAILEGRPPAISIVSSLHNQQILEWGVRAASKNHF